MRTAGRGTHPRKRARCSGTIGLEFTLVGIPLVFVLISVVEMARGMWLYNSLGHCVREGARYVSLKGENCSSAPNDCTSTVAGVAAKIRSAAIGFAPGDLNVTLSAPGDVRTCTPLAACLSDNSVWPAAPGNAVGSEVTVDATYTFRPAIAMYWPGSGAGGSFGTFVLPASSTERIQF